MDYERFLSLHRRDVACLLDNDRGAKTTALKRLDSACRDETNRGFLSALLIDHLHAPLTRLMSDPSERLRENAMELLLHMLSIPSLIDATIVPVCLLSICTRLREGSEPTEELRELLVRLVFGFIGCSPKSVLSTVSNDLIDAIARGVNDTCPEVKRKATEAVVLLSERLEISRFRSAVSTRSLVLALLAALKHQHWRVRVGALSALGSLLRLREGESDSPIISEYPEALTGWAVASDRAVQVRVAGAKAVGGWLRAGNIKDKTAVAYVENGQYCLVGSAEKFPGTLSWQLQCLYWLVVLSMDEEVEVCESAREEISSIAQQESSESSDLICPKYSPVSLLELLNHRPSLQYLFDRKRCLPLLRKALSVQFGLLASEEERVFGRRVLTVLALGGTELLSEIVAWVVRESHGILISRLLGLGAGWNLATPVLRSALAISQSIDQIATGLQVLGVWIPDFLERSNQQSASSLFLPILEEISEKFPTLPPTVLPLLVQAVRPLLPPKNLEISNDPTVCRLYSLLLRVGAKDLLRDWGVFTDNFFKTESAKLFRGNQSGRGSRAAVERLGILGTLVECTDVETVSRNLPLSVVPILEQEGIPRERSEEISEEVEARTSALGILHAFICRLVEQRGELTSRCPDLPVFSLLIPNCAWRPGNANSKLRKAALVCLHSALQGGLIVGGEALEILITGLAILRSCLDDSWVPDNRFIGLEVVRMLLEICNSPSLESNMFRDIYPELLKRLDDSQDVIRISACKALGCLLVKVSSPLERQWLGKGSMQYIAKGMLVHLDDSNEAVSGAVAEALGRAGGGGWLIEEIVASEARAARPRRFSDLADRVRQGGLSA